LTATTKKIVLLLIATGLALGAGEVVLRAMNYGVITPEMNFGVNTKMSLDQGQFLPDGDLFWKMPVHPLDDQFRSIQPDEPVPPKGAAQRILVLGDSCSKLSQQLPPYSVLLEDSLRGANVEVWNASVPGYTSLQGRAWLQKQLLAIEPDIAVIYFGWNDHWRSTGITDADYAAGQKGAALRLVSLFKKSPAKKPLRVTLDQYSENLTAMVSELRAQGTAVFLIAAPSSLGREARQRLVQTGYLTPQDNAVELHRDYLLRLKEVADSTDAVMLNISSLFAGLAPPRELIMRDGIHLTDRAHQVLAAVLAEACAPVLASGDAAATDQAALARRARAAIPPTPAEAR
jgi:lysophospholipase L1-like esterase